MCCDAITSKLLITHYFVVEFSSIVMLWLQNWWSPTILWDCDRTHMHCDAVTSKMMIDHYFVDRFFVLPLFRGPNSTNAVWRASCNARNFRRTFSWALLNLFCDRTHMHCDAVTSKNDDWPLFRGPIFVLRTFSWAEFDECNEEGPRNISACTKIHYNKSWALRGKK